MKFICENCKTKYQIADEKAAGKTVRMKCRKCGHAIEVRASVTETSAGGGHSSEVTATGEAVSRTSAPPPPNAAGQIPRGAIGSVPPAAPRPAPPRPPPRRPSTPPAERLGGTAAGAGTGATSGALASAFQRSMQRDEEVSASMDLSELSAADEWYVAIGGVPVGPVPIAEVRARAATGAVTEDSLCWQEGLEEWRPVRAFAELASIVREAALAGHTGRPSLVSTSDSYMGRSPVPPPAAERVAPKPAPPAPRPAAQRPFSQFEPLEDAGEDPTVAFSGALPNFNAPTPEQAAQANLRTAVPAAAVPDPFAARSTPFAAERSGLAVAASQLGDPSTVGIRTKKEVPVLMIGVILAFMMFGLTVGIGVVLTMRAPAPAAVAPVQSPPAVLAAPAVTVQTPPTAATPTAEEALVPVVPTQTSRPSGPATVAPKPSAPAAVAAFASDLKGLKGAGGNVAMGDDPASGSHGSGQCYTSGQISQVAGQRQVSLRRACWEKAGVTRSAANTNVTMTIGPTGKVESVAANGDDPSVAHCIENNVKTWQFPPMGCSQPVAIPFHFVRE